MVRTRQLGRTSLTVSEIGFGGAPAGLTNYLGTWDAASDAAADQIVQTVQRAGDLGVTYFDSAPGYGQGLSETMLGRAIQGRRAGLTIARKVTGDSAEAVRRSIEASLMRLQIEQLDVLQYHGGWYTDEQVTGILKPGGALAGMQQARDEGLVRFLGFTTEGANGQASTLLQTGAFDVIQLCYNLIFQHPYDPSRRAGLIYDAADRGMGIITMRSLTSGTFQRWLRAHGNRQIARSETQPRSGSGHKRGEPPARGSLTERYVPPPFHLLPCAPGGEQGPGRPPPGTMRQYQMASRP